MIGLLVLISVMLSPISTALAAEPATQPATQPAAAPDTASVGEADETIEKIVKTDAEWRKELSRKEYHILREKGTERAFSGDLYRLKDKGIYTCAGCGLGLFASETKYDSGTGWPSFYQPLKPNRVELVEDRSGGMVRTEVTCARCGGHLGHVFEDGPQPTGLRYCINSAALDFVKQRD